MISMLVAIIFEQLCCGVLIEEELQNGLFIIATIRFAAEHLK